VSIILIGDKYFELSKKTFVMGILNVTPDSFSDGGLYFNFDNAILRANEIIKQGADIIDIGGESTRPNYVKVSDREELDRVLPVIKKIKKNSIIISIDTTKSLVADEALKNGASLINDVSCLENHELAEIAAKYNSCICIQHNRKKNIYNDFFRDVVKDLDKAINLAIDNGVREDKIIIDPGIGFAKDLKQNLFIIKKVSELKRIFGLPILIGASRKKFIGEILNLDVKNRLEGTLAINAFAIMNGCNFIRVHDIVENIRMCKIIDALIKS
jgi:dihydropteroate synthase